MTEQWTNPECRQGKHGNCSDQAWDFISDELVACGCLCHEPEPVDCPNCGGTGRVTGDRFIGVTCPRCLGDGAVEP